MRKKKRCSLWTGFLLLVMVVSSLILVQEEAFAQEDTVVYDASSMTTFKNRTIKNIFYPFGFFAGTGTGSEF